MSFRQLTPKPGQPVRRDGKPYIWTTHLAKLLGGNQCLWSAWFKAHFKYSKFETMGEQLAEWNRDHNAMMRDRVAELEENGWTVKTEDQNAFKLAGQAAVVAGKPDIVATWPGDSREVLVVDGKTGREREADTWQVLIYLMSLPLTNPDLAGVKLAGEVHYKVGDKRVPVPLQALSDDRRDDIVRMVKVIASPTAPRRAPSKHECSRCNIGFADCPERFREADDVEETPAAAAGF
jgi:CRISPR/Cas system-associated exonuclease Cas4 (RecB family)